MSLYRQKQLQEEENTIPERSITKWHLDCMKECSKSEAFEMAIKHYSCVNDEVVDTLRLYNALLADYF